VAGMKHSPVGTSNTRPGGQAAVGKVIVTVFVLVCLITIVDVEETVAIEVVASVTISTIVGVGERVVLDVVDFVTVTGILTSM
jgi:hypothetical protein